MRELIGALVARARGLVAQPITVGLARAKWVSLVEGLDVDFYQAHWYDHVEAGRLPRPVADLGLDRPIVLGEFPTAGSAYTADALVAHAAAAGYAGTWPWSILAEDGATDRAAVGRALDAERLARPGRMDHIDRSRATEEGRGDGLLD